MAFRSHLSRQLLYLIQKHAVSFAKLKEYLSDSLKFVLQPLWTDPKIVLDRLATPSKVGKAYVANRVSQIHDLALSALQKPNSWQAPADLATRQWRNRPAWILKSAEYWMATVQPRHTQVLV